MAAPRDKRKHDPTFPGAVRPAVRVAASLALAFHLLAVFAGPMSVGRRSALGNWLQAWFRPYNEMHYLNVGYRFFDEPGPSHRIEYQIEFRDGRPTIVGVFPDREVHWPRLLYHRHFMLSEMHQSLSVPDAPPPDVSTDAVDYRLWSIGLKTYQAYSQSYGEHLLRRYGGQKVTLYGLERRLPAPDEVLQGKRIDDPQFVRRTDPLVVVNASQ